MSSSPVSSCFFADDSAIRNDCATSKNDALQDEMGENSKLLDLLKSASPLRSKMARAAASSELRAERGVPIPIPATEKKETETPATEKKEKKSKKNGELPPVICVKRMPTKGCAIVLLRDRRVLELSVAMRVAVVDGVCVEVKQHVRKPKEGESPDAYEDELGVFVAWGHRVARRVDVSEEGLEAYFNGLSAVSGADDLDVAAPFQEKLQRFDFSSEGPLELNLCPETDAADQEKMLSGPHGQPELVKDLWEVKALMEEIWQKPPPPMGRSLMQRVARDQLFPHSGKEGKEHENRAGEKLEELACAVDLLEGVPKGSAFLDLCGGPGAWSQYLLAKHDLAFRGFGFTLRSASGADEDWQSQEKDDWYPDLLQHPNWTALWGADGRGDLLSPENLKHSAAKLRKKGGVFLVVADGGFSDKAIPPNLLELYFYRLFLAEILMAASCLQEGGRFVCKLYTSCSAATSALLFLTTRLFEKSAIVKPKTSRVAGPERYLYASGFKSGEETESICAALMKSQEVGAGAGPLQKPLLTPVIAEGELLKDSTFMSTLRSMVGVLLNRQAGSLRATLERAERLEEIALDAAEDSSNGASRWAAAAAAQKEAREAAKAAEEATRVPREDRRRHFGRDGRSFRPLTEREQRPYSSNHGDRWGELRSSRRNFYSQTKDFH
eukprot:TRINITY_DN354_c2_g1_i1.p1 TRINITY_DN354_c2_g1~~TRINITY_DN354_c2_g1_i1.p1  ORF type:complete len:668 (-),score=174.72 TRINITY_DN354_c2_g1_i1:535-2538(-)